MGMTAYGYVGISVKQEGRDALTRLSIMLANALGRRVSQSETLVLLGARSSEVVAAATQHLDERVQK